MKSIIDRYTKIYRFFYPVLFIACATQALVTEQGRVIMNSLINEYPNIPFYLGTPVYIIVAILAISGLLAFFAGRIYQADMDVIYGRALKKLDEIIADMEELRR